MAEYIERDALEKWLLTEMASLDTEEDRQFVVERIREAIPAADVRPVVLCRDCKHNMANIPDIQDGININENWNACQLTELYDSVKPDDFCSCGVKRERKADGT